MVWNAGVDLAVGTVVTPTIWNSYLGTVGSIEYLKVEADKLNVCSQADMTASRALGTVYQNTSGKTRFATVTVLLGGAAGQVNAYCGTATSPSIIVARGAISDNGSGATILIPLPFIVPNNYYYKASSVAGSPTMQTWVECDLH